MITTRGKEHIKRYFAEYEPTIASTIAFGISDTSATLADTRMGFEAGRTEILVKSYDFVNDKLVLKAAIPDYFQGTIHELGVFANVLPDETESTRILAQFDSIEENWVNPSTGLSLPFATTGVRLGTDGLSLTPAASATSQASWPEIAMDLSDFTGQDEFAMYLNVGNANTNSASVLFITDISNYYYFTWTTPVQTAGYKKLTTTKANMLVIGNPNWSKITEIRTSVVSKASGASAVTFDGIRINDVDALNPSSVLVARSVLSVPFVKTSGKVQEIEYSLDIDI